MNDTITLPTVGDKVRAKYIPSITGRDGREWTNDYVLTVSRVDPNYSWFQDGESKNGPVVWGDFIDPDTGASWHYYVTQWEPIVDTDIVEPPKSVEQQEITALKECVENMRDELVRVKSEAVAAIATIGERLIDESNSRGWCDEFDRIIGEVNEELPSWLELPIRNRDYIVTWTEYITISVRRSTSVSAPDADTAISLAQDDDYGCDSSDVIEAIRCGDWESTDTSDWEAEED